MNNDTKLNKFLNKIEDASNNIISIYNNMVVQNKNINILIDEYFDELKNNFKNSSSDIYLIVDYFLINSKDEKIIKDTIDNFVDDSYLIYLIKNNKINILLKLTNTKYYTNILFLLKTNKLKPFHEFIEDKNINEDDLLEFINNYGIIGFEDNDKIIKSMKYEISSYENKINDNEEKDKIIEEIIYKLVFYTGLFLVSKEEIHILIKFIFSDDTNYRFIKNNYLNTLSKKDINYQLIHKLLVTEDNKLENRFLNELFSLIIEKNAYGYLFTFIKNLYGCQRDAELQINTIINYIDYCDLNSDKNIRYKNSQIDYKQFEELASLIKLELNKNNTKLIKKSHCQLLIDYYKKYYFSKVSFKDKILYYLY